MPHVLLVPRDVFFKVETRREPDVLDVHWNVSMESHAPCGTRTLRRKLRNVKKKEGCPRDEVETIRDIKHVDT